MMHFTMWTLRTSMQQFFNGVILERINAVLSVSCVPQSGNAETTVLYDRRNDDINVEEIREDWNLTTVTS